MNNKRKPDTLKSGEGERRANIYHYLDRRSATILMVIKLAEGLSKLCLAILGAVMLQTVVTSLNRVFQEGTTVADGQAMVAQILKTLRVPPETIKQVIDAFPLDITFSSGPFVIVFLIFLPFVLIAMLEAIAAIRLRLGKGGAGMIGVLQRIYYVLGVIRLLAIAICAIGVSIFTIVRLGGTPSIVLSTIYVSLAVFFILVGLPTLLYHRNVARIMDEVGYEMETGKMAVRKHLLFDEILTALIVLEVIGALVSLIASWNPQQGGLAVALFVAGMIGPAARLIKYICVKCCYRNYMGEDSAEEAERASHVPQIILILLVTLFFAIPIIVVGKAGTAFSNAVVEKVEEFFSNARQTVNEVSTMADAQIETAQSLITAQAEAMGLTVTPETQAEGNADAAELQAEGNADAAEPQAEGTAEARETKVEATADAAESDALDKAGTSE